MPPAKTQIWRRAGPARSNRFRSKIEIFESAVSWAPPPKKGFGEGKRGSWIFNQKKSEIFIRDFEGRPPKRCFWLGGGGPFAQTGARSKSKILTRDTKKKEIRNKTKTKVFVISKKNSKGIFENRRFSQNFKEILKEKFSNFETLSSFQLKIISIEIETLKSFKDFQKENLYWEACCFNKPLNVSIKKLFLIETYILSEVERIKLFW